MRWLIVVVAVLLAMPAAAQQTVNFGWDAAANADGYVLQVGTSPGGTVTTQAGAATTAAVTFPTPGTFYIRVVAFNTVGFSGPSNEVAVTIVGPPPPPTDPCVATPLLVTVTQWPQGKKTLTYTASQNIASVSLITRRSQVTGAVFMDTRTCTVTVTR